MSNNKAIQIILRVRPHSDYYSGIKINEQSNEITIMTPKDESQGYINNQQETVKFKFDQIFDKNAEQEKVFDRVAKEVVEEALEGFNGTIFAYGQTGSGKTYTMTGADTTDGMGIIPRTLQHIYKSADTKGVSVRVKIRYMQIYNGSGYDLLDPKLDLYSSDKVKLLEDLEKVKPLQSADGNLKLQNLSVHEAKNLQQASDFLMIGDTNRITCQTLKNDQSTRSHCIFMINLQTSHPDSDIKKIANINLVDLSGSQKLKNTSYDENIEKQAININLGLHYLQRLIVSLNKKMRGQNVHIPYRESLINMVLRDSIGGNCITRMIATMSPKQDDMLQSISTCKFAQRVALIKNDVRRNETVDPAVIIARLKRENLQLKAELAMLRGEDVKEELDKWEIQDCHKAVRDYIESEDPAASLVMGDRLKINQCFYFFKSLVKKGGMPIDNKSVVSQNMGSKSSGLSSQDQQRYEQEIKKLKIALQSRDNQIVLLLSLISKKRGNQNSQQIASVPVNRIKPEQQQIMKSVLKEKPIEFTKPQKEEDQRTVVSKGMSEISTVKTNNYINQSSNDQSRNLERSIVANRSIDEKQIQNMLIKPLHLTSQDFLDHAKAFETFRVSARRNQTLIKNSEILKQKMSEGKQIGAILYKTKQKINTLKNNLQEIIRDSALQNIVDGNKSENPREAEIREQLMRTKKEYQEYSLKLKSLKYECEHIENLIQNNRKQLAKDFQTYAKFWFQKRQQTVANVDAELRLKSSKIKDKEVQKHFDSFLKAREELKKKMG